MVNERNRAQGRGVRVLKMLGLRYRPGFDALFEAGWLVAPSWGFFRAWLPTTHSILPRTLPFLTLILSTECGGLNLMDAPARCLWRIISLVTGCRAEPERVDWKDEPNLEAHRFWISFNIISIRTVGSFRCQLAKVVSVGGKPDLWDLWLCNIVE